MYSFSYENQRVKTDKLHIINTAFVSSYFLVRICLNYTSKIKNRKYNQLMQIDQPLQIGYICPS